MLTLIFSSISPSLEECSFSATPILCAHENDRDDPCMTGDLSEVQPGAANVCNHGLKYFMGKTHLSYSYIMIGEIEGEDSSTYRHASLPILQQSISYDINTASINPIKTTGNGSPAECPRCKYVPYDIKCGVCGRMRVCQACKYVLAGQVCPTCQRRRSSLKPPQVLLGG